MFKCWSNPEKGYQNVSPQTTVPFRRSLLIRSLQPFSALFAWLFRTWECWLVGRESNLSCMQTTSVRWQIRKKACNRPWTTSNHTATPMTWRWILQNQRYWCFRKSGCQKVRCFSKIILTTVSTRFLCSPSGKSEERIDWISFSTPRSTSAPLPLDLA